jgi:hypothetical protein
MVRDWRHGSGAVSEVAHARVLETAAYDGADLGAAYADARKRGIWTRTVRLQGPRRQPSASLVPLSK